MLDVNLSNNIDKNFSICGTKNAKIRQSAKKSEVYSF